MKKIKRKSDFINYINVKKKILYSLSFLFFCFLLNSCKTIEGIRVTGFNYPLPDLQKAVLMTLPNGKSTVDSTGRKFKSRHFLVQGDEFLKLDSPHPETRYFTEVMIIGFSRPYSLEVIVFEEKILKKESKNVSSFDYQTVALDLEIAEIILNKIKENLLKRKNKNKSFIDDFRIF